MDPASLVLSFFLQNPKLAANAYDQAMTPGSVEVSRMQESLVDLSRGVLFCYHRTARFGQVDYIGTPFNRERQYGAERSMVLRIRYAGMGAINQYQMVVAVMEKQGRVRSAVLADTAAIPYNKRCALEDWVGA